MQTATVSAIREKAKGRCKVVLGKFHQGIAEVHCLPHSLDLPPQRCCVGYWLPWTLSLSPLLSRNFRETFAKILCKSIEKSTPWIVVGGSASSTWLQYIYIVLGLFSTRQNNSEGPHFTEENQRLSRLSHLIKINVPYFFRQINIYFRKLRKKCGVLCCNTGGVCNSQSLHGPLEGLPYINTHTL